MQALSEKFMSDEETDDENNSSLIKRSLTWRSEKLNKLIVKLDERYFHSRERKENSKPMKNRRKGNPSERLPLANFQIFVGSSEPPKKKIKVTRDLSVSSQLFVSVLGSLYIYIMG